MFYVYSGEQSLLFLFTLKQIIMEEKIKEIAKLVKDKDYSFEDLLKQMHLYSLLNEKDIDMLIKFLKLT